MSDEAADPVGDTADRAKSRSGDFTITFKDGTTAEGRIGVAEIVAIERRWQSSVIPAFESTMYGMWVALDRPKPPGMRTADPEKIFDAWLATVADIDEHQDDAPVPTQPAAGDD